MRLPGLLALTFGRNAQCGSKNTTCRPLTNPGMSVRWYTELNPTPKRPVFPTCVRFTLSPMRLMLSKSLSRKTLSLCTSSDAPWNPASFAYAKEETPCERSSRHTRTHRAPASSCEGGVKEGAEGASGGSLGGGLLRRGTADRATVSSGRERVSLARLE